MIRSVPADASSIYQDNKQKRAESGKIQRENTADLKESRLHFQELRTEFSINPSFLMIKY